MWTLVIYYIHSISRLSEINGLLAFPSIAVHEGFSFKQVRQNHLPALRIYWCWKGE